MTSLPAAFLSTPFAHRGLHGQVSGCPENSLPAFEAAIAHGYGIELDLQLSKDGQAMVFHDYSLSRLTDEIGPIAQRSAAELSCLKLKGSAAHVPTLREILAFVAGRVPLLIELKDQDGALGPDVGKLEAATTAVLEGYEGPAALMSFNPHSVAALAAIAPRRPRGIVSCAFTEQDWPTIPAMRRRELMEIPDFERCDACFISHDVNDLDSPALRQLKADGAPVLCWTVKSVRAEETARRTADNITFEGYLPDNPHTPLEPLPRDYM